MSSFVCLGNLISRQFGSAGAQALTSVGGDGAYAAGMSDRTRAARVEDVHRIAMAMPHVTVMGGTKDNPVYQVGGKSFVFFRNPRPTPSTRTVASATATSSCSGSRTRPRSRR
jgi:hypothetical protein